MEFLEVFLKVFGLVSLAEFGDKSQLVCMALAARYRGAPVLFGAMAAFMLLNLLAVAFGAAISQLVPESAVYLVVAVLFLFFGVQSFRADHEGEDGEFKVGKHLLISVFLLIFLAELGDKTQIALAGLAAVEVSFVVWMAGTAALFTTTVVGVWFGSSVLTRLPIDWLHRAAGILFTLFSLAAFWHFYMAIN